MINKIKKLKLPVLVGLILGCLDLALWILFLGYWFINRHELYLSEGLMLMMLLHAPSSILLPLLGGVFIAFLNLLIPGSVNYLLPQTFFLLMVGVAQYYFIGYFIGWLIVRLRRRFGFGESTSEKKIDPKSSRVKTWTLNILYFLFIVLVMQMVFDIGFGILNDFEMYKLNYPPTRHYLEVIIFILWLYSTHLIVGYNRRKEMAKNTNRVLLIFGVLIIIIYSGVYIPRWSKTDVPGTTPLEGYYARQQAKIFFDNPLEQIIIMKTAIAGEDEKNYQVDAYTFFGFKYREVDIEKISEYEMRLLLNPNMQKLQYEAQVGVMEIIDRIKHPWMHRVSYSELIKEGRFSQEEIRGIIPGINNTNSIFFKTDDKDHDVYLLVYLEDAYTNAMRKDFNFEDEGQGQEYIYNTKNIKIAKAHQVAALDSYQIIYNNRPYYIIFDVLSDQKMPDEIDYVWQPDHNIRQDDIKYILKSVLGNVSKNNYFDNDLKLSFTYPENFYVEKEALGPNFDIAVTPFAPDDPNRENPEGFIYTSLRMKKVAKGEEYNALLDYFHKKAADKELYPSYEERDMEINGNKIKLIKFVFGFSGGLDVNYLLDAQDYILHVSFYNDTLYADEYGEIAESIIIVHSITDELSVRFMEDIPGIDISHPEKSSLWWNDNEGYSIIVPGTESIELAKDDGVVDNFPETDFARNILDITDGILTARGFVLNEKNTSDDETDRKFYDYVRSYEKNNELCVLRVNPDYGSSGCGDSMYMCNSIEITCGNDLAGSQAEQRPFLEALGYQNKETVVLVRKKSGDYFQVSVGHRRTGSDAVIKKEAEDLRLIYMSQEDPFCEIIEKENIPDYVFEDFGINGCWTKEGYKKFSEI